MCSHLKLRLGVALAGLLAPVPTDDLPVDEWLARANALETLVVDFEVTSASGKVAEVHFAYAAPQRCHMRAVADGELSTEVWFDDAQAVMHMLQADGTWVSGELNWARMGERPYGWLDGLKEALPSPEPTPTSVTGPILFLWPFGAEDRVDFSLSYHLERTSVLGFLHRLERGGFEARELEDGWALAVEGSARLELEPELGIPRGCWLGTGEDERRALVLTKLEIDGEFDEAELTPGAPPAGAVDRSEALMASLGRSIWQRVRELSFVWLSARAKEGVDLAGEERAAVVERFAAFHGEWAREQIEACAAAEERQFDEWLDPLADWYDQHRERPDAAAKLAKALEEGRAGEEQRLARQVAEYAAHVAKLELPSGMELVLELEAEGIALAFDEALVRPVMAHVNGRLAEFD